LDDFFDLIRRNIVGFRKKHPEFNEIPIIVETETNSRFDGDIVEKYLSFQRIFGMDDNFIGDLEFAAESSTKRTGVIKTYPRTRQYVFHFNNALVANKFKISKRLSTSNRNIGIKRILKEAKDEMCRFSWPDVDHDNPRYINRRGPSGKVGGKNDDMSIVIQMLVFYAYTRKVEKEAMHHYIKIHANGNHRSNDISSIINQPPREFRRQGFLLM